MKLMHISRRQISRRTLLKAGVAISATMGATTVFAQPLKAAPPPPSAITPALIEAARKEELLVPPDQLKKMYILRRILNPMGTMDAIDFLLDKLRNTKSNSDFFESMNA